VTQAPSLPSAEALDTAIRDRIATLLAGKLGCGVEHVDDHRRFDTYGLASIDAIDVMGDLEGFLDLELSPTLLNDFPTVAELTAHVGSLARAR
jgi:acyl carrier protein